MYEIILGKESGAQENFRWEGRGTVAPERFRNAATKCLHNFSLQLLFETFFCPVNI
jgi:hypothetical protein